MAMLNYQRVMLLPWFMKHKFIRLPWCPPLRQNTAGRCAMRTQRGGLDADPHRSGKAIENDPFIVSFPIKNGDFSIVVLVYPIMITCCR